MGQRHAVGDDDRRRVEKELRESREQLRGLAARLESVREEERRHIAREIHDELGQMLTSLKIDLRWIEKRLAGEAPSSTETLLKRVRTASELTVLTLEKVRSIAAELRPGILDSLGLAPALRHEGLRFEERTGIRFEIKLPEREYRLSDAVATALFRIFQEALTNAARHAGATKVSAELKVESRRVRLRVRDNGRGITDAEISSGVSLGLLGMRERSELLGGKFAIGRFEAGGTAVDVSIPR